MVGQCSQEFSMDTPSNHPKCKVRSKSRPALCKSHYCDHPCPDSQWIPPQIEHDETEDFWIYQVLQMKVAPVVQTNEMHHSVHKQTEKNNALAVWSCLI